ncbi:uncharacterized protein ACBR49_007675 [Aulostomus maculatus]
MDGVLEGAAVMCLCKLVCSLLFLPSLTSCHSPVSFCCCCLLIFTDFLVAVSLSLLSIFESWLTELIPQGDIIALRFLLFLSHTYGAVLLLVTPLIAVETLAGLLWPDVAVAHRAVGQTVGSDGQRCNNEEETVAEGEDGPDKHGWLCHGVGYVCCLSVWVVVALNVRYRSRLEEVRAADCLHSSNSLIRCLPNLLSPMPTAMNPFWGMAFLSLLLLLLTSSSGRYRWRWAGLFMESTHRGNHGVNTNSEYHLQNLVPGLAAPSKSAVPGMSVSVDPEKTESSCTVHTAYSWNSVQMSTCHHGDSVLLSQECLSAEQGGQEHNRIKGCVPLIFIMKHMNPQHRRSCEWDFPRLGVNIMIGFMALLSIFVLPLYLSVNILLIRSIEALLELCIKS